MAKMGFNFTKFEIPVKIWNFKIICYNINFSKINTYTSSAQTKYDEYANNIQIKVSHQQFNSFDLIKSSIKKTVKPS